MIKITRRQALSSILTVSGGCVFAPALVRAQAQFRWKCGTTVSSNHPLTQGMIRAADQIRQSTGGKVDIQVFPSSQLGSQTDMISQVRSGALELTPVSCVVLSSLSPLAAISGVAYAFDDYQDAWRTMDGPLGDLVRRNIERANLTVFDRVWDGGFFQIMSAPRALRSPNDLKGFKLRVPPARLWISMYEALGASPSAIAWGEVYMALQTKVVDGVDSALINFNDAKMFEVQKFASLTRHMWDGFWLLSGRRVFERLPTELRDIVKTAFDSEAIKQRDQMVNLEKQILTDLQGRDMEVVTPDREAFRTALKATNYYQEWRSKLGDEAWGLLSQGSGKTF